MATFRNAIANNKNLSRTDNGAVTLKSSTNPLVDLFFLVGASRGKNLTTQYNAAFSFNPELTSSLMLWARDIRGGAGERQLFRDYLTWLENRDLSMAALVVCSGKVHEVGRWDDYLVFSNPELQHLAFTQIAKGLSDKNTVGLVAKWMPRQGKVASQLGSFFGLSARNWRKSIVRSTNVVEQLMCAKEWNAITYDHVPSVAAARYQKAFTRHSPEKYSAYRESLKKNDGSAKINASTVYPYDVLKSVAYGDEVVAQAQWDALPNYLGTHGNILPIVDVSGSMGTSVPGTKVSMMDVAISVGLYIALKQQGDFNRVIMNFSSESEIINLKTKTLRKLYNEVAGMSWGMSTNLDAAFQNLLTFGIRNKVSDVEMPKTILVISDMQFNNCGRLTNYENIKVRYQQAGYTIPKIVFWCVNGRPENIPVTSKQENVALVSGFSPAIMKNILACENVTPEAVMMKTITNVRYSLIPEFNA